MPSSRTELRTFIVKIVSFRIKNKCCKGHHLKFVSRSTLFVSSDSNNEAKETIEKNQMSRDKISTTGHVGKLGGGK